ncbi:D-alanyl-D-alanine carboxypeptidase [Kibdelosporangium phytohabitans]|uniref:Beta-lactamase-related domain-containing protein n=1 Tax=Kibdelosporangium phytohabitans TaxID=860235 RepID=A0A0N9I1R3_9PSEU|nr:hypothetical protein AOZ06_24185 [Kibdelosporangium phytohabitans]MBE1469080.1 D-alanyl-D-alanine carboxypeptidase [Kibdelosporangium phytohabitans]
MPRWECSSTNYLLAGMLVERITGRSVADEVTRRTIVPLGLTTTYYPKDYETWVHGPHPRGYVDVAGGRYDYTNRTCRGPERPGRWPARART